MPGTPGSGRAREALPATCGHVKHGGENTEVPLNHKGQLYRLIHRVRLSDCPGVQKGQGLAVAGVAGASDPTSPYLELYMRVPCPPTEQQQSEFQGYDEGSIGGPATLVLRVTPTATPTGVRGVT